MNLNILCHLSHGHSPLRKESLAPFLWTQWCSSGTWRELPKTVSLAWKAETFDSSPHQLLHQESLQPFDMSVGAVVSQQNNLPSSSCTLTSEKSLPWVCISVDFILKNCMGMPTIEMVALISPPYKAGAHAASQGSSMVTSPRLLELYQKPWWSKGRGTFSKCWQKNS